MNLEILSVKDYPQLKNEAIAYCMNHWNKVLSTFTSCIEESAITVNPLPKTYLLLKGNILIGFYQLTANECVMRKDLTPWITTLFIDEGERGNNLGALLLEHGKKIAGELGYDKVFLTTNHIQYYEKNGFIEIGLDNFEWGSPTKLYEGDTITDIHYSVFRSQNEIDDDLLAKLACFRWNTPHEKIPSTVTWMKENHFGQELETKWFEIIAFNSTNEIVGFVFFMRNPNNSKNWYMGDLSVSESYQKKGIASKLIKKGLRIIAAYTSGGDFIYSYIEKGNIPSIKLHEKLGFKNTGDLLPFAHLCWSDDQITYEYRFKPIAQAV